MATQADIARRALGLIDLTDLSDDASESSVDELCAKAVGPHGRVAAVCVWPAFVPRCVERLRGTGVRVATVVNFPHGGDDVDHTAAETRRAIADGADEIDLVLPYHAFVRGELGTVIAMVEAVRGEVPVDGGRLLKVILETGALPDDEAIAAATALAISHGADFVKTSTGKIANSASLSATAAMLKVIHNSGHPVGIKPSGGIRTVHDAELYICQADEVMGEGWATPATFRLGASGLLDAVLAEIEGAGGAAPSSA